MKPTIQFLIWLHASRDFDNLEALRERREHIERTRDVSLGTYGGYYLNRMLTGTLPVT